ncbi:MAG: aspartyl/asparaginyl beta-hydroxylase domain-containing protein [Gammaproteobacteria bacterium]|nr:aspartyl/asparaginyl beta-hydroxylase domain-containing protein [Gammaproteobacteria bacterium]
MDIGVEYKRLGPVDEAPLRDAILQQPEKAWTEQPLRQQSYEVHQDTESIVLLFCDEAWPDGEIYQELGWARLHEAAMPLIERILADHYLPGGNLIRAMAAKLKAGGRIVPHRDTLPSFCIGHRIHVPITTNSGVQFNIAGKPCRLQVGQAYEINNQARHSVINMGREDRISFIFDYVPPQS